MNKGFENLELEMNCFLSKDRKGHPPSGDSVVLVGRDRWW